MRGFRCEIAQRHLITDNDAQIFGRPSIENNFIVCQETAGRSVGPTRRIPTSPRVNGGDHGIGDAAPMRCIGSVSGWFRKATDAIG